MESGIKPRMSRFSKTEPWNKGFVMNGKSLLVVTVMTLLAVIGIESFFLGRSVASNQILQAENAQQRIEIARLQTALAAERAPSPGIIEETDTYTMRHPPNDAILIVETRARLTDQYELFTRRGTTFNHPVEVSVEELAADLMDIEGVLEVHVSEYELSVHKANSYTWEELLPIVRPLIVAEFGGESIKEVGAVPGIGAT